MSDSPSHVGTAAADITPPLEVGLLMASRGRRWAPFQRLRMPLEARALVIAHAGERIALLNLDLLGLAENALGDFDAFKHRLAAGTGIPAENLVLTSTHTHTGPESIALTDLYKTPAFKHWQKHLEQQISTALLAAARTLRPCRFGVATGHAPGLSIYRRVRTTKGVILTNDPVPEGATVLSRGGPTDDALRLAAFIDDSGRPLALLVNATCHPIHEMCLPQISPDYPGELARDLSRRHPGSTTLFFNGAAGNINPPTFSTGAAAAQAHARQLADIVDTLLPHLRFIDAAPKLARSRFTLPARNPAMPPIPVRLAALAIGDAAFLFMPGEPFVEIGLAVLKNSPFPFTAFAAYAEDYIGYLPTESAFDEGGYELGPGDWSRTAPGTEPLLLRQSANLLHTLRTNTPAPT